MLTFSYSGGLFSSKTQLKDKANVFSLGDRIQVLSNADSGIVLAYVAEEQHMVDTKIFLSKISLSITSS